MTILALGVAALFSIRLANRAALDGFRYFSENLTGGSDLVLRSPSGKLPVAVLSDLRNAAGGLPLGIFPILESTAALVDETDNDNAKANAPLLRLTGVDLAALGNAIYLDPSSRLPGTTASTLEFSDQAEFSGPGDASQQPRNNDRLGSASLVWVGAGFLDRHQLSVGDPLSVVVNDEFHTLQIAGRLFSDPTRPKIPDHLLLFDLPGLQSLLSDRGALTRIELRVAGGADRERHLDSIRTKVAKLAADGDWMVETPDDRVRSSQAMTSAFRLNLTVLSSLALLVGVYLILQALEAAVVRRRQEIGILRSLGVTRRQIRRAWLLEALALGVIGTGFGLLLGWGAAQFAVGNIAKTVSALYHETTTTAAGWHGGEALFAAVFGIGASLVAGWLPAQDAASTPPVQNLRGANRSRGPRTLRRPWLGIFLLIAGWILCQCPPVQTVGGTKIPLGGYLAALAWLASLSILSGLLFRPLGIWLCTKRSSAPARRYAGSQLRQPTGRHRLTAAGLVVAVGMAAGMGILVHSFESTLSGWIRQLLKADLYVAPAGIGSASSEGTLSEQSWQTLASDPAVAGVDVIRRHAIVFDGRRTILAGSEYADHDDSLRHTWRQAPVDRDPGSLIATSSKGHVRAWVSESFAIRFDKQRGDSIEIPTPAGPKALDIMGVYIDYHNEAGTVLVNRRHLVDWFDGDNAISNMAIFLRQDASADEVRERWTRHHPALVIRTNQRLRDEALRVFHQTFAVTHALEAIGIGVAVIGLALTLASLMIERRGEIAVLHQLGMKREQLATATAIESLGIACIGTVAGLLLSLALGYVLIHVVNRQSFGWTLQFAVPWTTLLSLSAFTLLTSLGVGWLIGQRPQRTRSEAQE